MSDTHTRSGIWTKIKRIWHRSSSQESEKKLRSTSPTNIDRKRSEISTFDFPKGTLGVAPIDSRQRSPHSRERSRDRRADPLGLSVIYEPDHAPSVDIIFVHGLGGTSRQTWSKNRDPELFWPQKWLPKEPDICTARILSFGYNAHFLAVGPRSVSSISDFAKSLLFEMKYGKDEGSQDLQIGKLPIIFVVHSMGGLVFKKAYLQGSSNDDYKEIVAKIQAVLFLSTPHRGTNLAEVLNRILTVSIVNSPKHYVAELNRNSAAIEDLNEVFRNIAPKLQLFSFYETLQTSVGPKSMMVLEKDSSILGYPGEVSQPLNGNHHDVCKFASQQDSNYKSVRSVIQTLVSYHRQAGQRIERANCQADIKKVKSLLSVDGAPEEDYTTLWDSWKVGTCGAMLSEPAFVEWVRDSPTSSILWAYAAPGSGKSIQSSFLINHLLESGYHCSYFFFKYADSTKRSANSLLRSLAFQVAQDIPSFHLALGSLDDEGMRVEKADARTIWRKIFLQILFRYELSKPLYWIIDALDESESTNTIIDLLQSISCSKSPIRILIMSRQTPLITAAFDRISNKVQLTRFCFDQRIEDIHTYVADEMQYMHGGSALRKTVVDQIVQRAEGNFLWVHLAVKEIMQSHGEDDIKQALEEVPSGMEPLYHRMEATIAHLTRASDKSLARLILLWTLYSRQPLGAKDLLRALLPDFPSILDLKHTIDQVCGHFVVVDSKDRIALVHQTAREYLMKASKLTFRLDQHESHEELFQRTLSVWLDPNIRSASGQTVPPPFYHYSATSWAYHLNRSSVIADVSLDLLVKFFQNSYVLYWIQALAALGQLKVLVYTSQSLASYIKKRQRADSSRNPLLHRLLDLGLLELWAVDLLKVVGKFGDNLLQDPATILTYIPHFCPRNSALYRHAGVSNKSRMSVTGVSDTDWDDCLARVSVGNERRAVMVICSGRYLAVLTSLGTVVIWDSLTFAELRTLSHHEHIFTICFNASGDKLASYGFHTTRIWSVSTGRLLRDIPNTTGTRALCITFAENDTVLLLGSDLRKVERIVLEDQMEGWQDLEASLLEDSMAVKGTFLNSPTSIAFNGEATQIAIAYRGFPLSIWSLRDSKVISRCKRWLEGGGKNGSTWTGVNRVTWHPHSGDVLGIYTDGTVFKWHPLEANHHELRADSIATPSEIQISSDGLTFATSDVNGAVKIYNFQHFALIYQLFSEDIVTALCFSPDGRRFYDLRGSYCNVWEPNVLIRLSDSDERASEIETETGSTTVSCLASEAWVKTMVPITALATRSQSALVCVGNEDGVVEILDTANEKKLEIGKSAIELSVEHLVWGEDGCHIAFAEVGGRLSVKAIESQGEDEMKMGWKYQSILDIKLNLDNGAIHQLLLSPDSTSILVASLGTVQIWSFGRRSIVATYTPKISGVLQKWTNHPMKEDQIIAFSPTTVTAYDWGSLEELTRWQIKIPDHITPVETERQMPGLPRSNSLGNSMGVAEPDEVIDRVIVTQAREHFLLSIAPKGPNYRHRNRLQIIKFASLELGSGEVECVPIPEAIADMIERPLDVLTKDRLVFLDTSFWVCTWHLGTGDFASGLTRHFFLPRDWIDADMLRLCHVLADGTFLCPRKGELAVIRSDLGVGW